MTNAITPVFGTSGSDTLNGGNTGDLISARRGDDTINANGGNDLARRGDRDLIFGGGGPALIDMTQFTIAEDHASRVIFISEGAGFRNSLVMYRS